MHSSILCAAWSCQRHGVHGWAGTCLHAALAHPCLQRVLPTGCTTHPYSRAPTCTRACMPLCVCGVQMADALISFTYNASPEELSLQLRMGVYNVALDLLCRWGLGCPGCVQGFSAFSVQGIVCLRHRAGPAFQGNRAAGDDGTCSLQCIRRVCVVCRDIQHVRM